MQIIQDWVKLIVGTNHEDILLCIRFSYNELIQIQWSIKYYKAILYILCYIVENVYEGEADKLSLYTRTE